MIHPIVPITPTHSTLESRPITVIRRYNKNAVNRHAAIATSVAGIATQLSWNFPSSGRSRLKVRAAHTRSSPGQKNAAYCDSPTQPEAIESGALNEICQINKNEI